MIASIELASRTTAASTEVMYVGENEFFGPELIRLASAAGYAVTGFDDAAETAGPAVCSPAAATSPTTRWIVVAFQPTGAEIRSLIRSFGHSIEHLILISSYKVYPAVFRTSPWRAEDFDALADGGASGDGSEAGRTRVAERELWLEARHIKRCTVLRPALIEGINNPLAYSAWFVNRMLDGSPVVLPDEKMVIYRYVSVADLARAALAVAGKEQASGKTLNVVSRGILTYRGHARLLGRALQKQVTFKYVPLARWRTAGLPLPVADDLSASFIASSALLTDLGWEPSDDECFFTELGSVLEEFPRSANRAIRSRELKIAAESRDGPEVSLRYNAGIRQKQIGRQWALAARPGDADSLTLQCLPAQKLRSPVLKMRRLAFGELEIALLRGELGATDEPRVIGHNALFEVVDDGSSGIARGSSVLPLSTTPCGDEACSLCIDGEPRTLGIDCDGCARALSSMPVCHLIVVKADLAPVALLANPLAALIEATQQFALDGSRTAWICGDTVEAALLTWMLEDAGLEVAIVGREPRPHSEFPIHDVGDRVRKVNEGSVLPPDLIVDFDGNFEMAMVLGPACRQAKAWWGSQPPSRLPPDLPFKRLPAVASSRGLLLQALALLESWSQWRDVNALVGPPVELEAYWDALLPPPFMQPFMESGDR